MTPQDAYGLLLGRAAWCAGRIHASARGLVAKIPPDLPLESARDRACLALLAEPSPALQDALRLTPEGEALLAAGWPSSPPDGDVQEAAARAGELDEAQFGSLAVLALDGLRHWRTFDLLSGDIHARMEDGPFFTDWRNAAAALFMQGEAACEELLALAGTLGGRSPADVRAEIDAVANDLVAARARTLPPKA